MAIKCLSLRIISVQLAGSSPTRHKVDETREVGAKKKRMCVRPRKVWKSDGGKVFDTLCDKLLVSHTVYMVRNACVSIR